MLQELGRVPREKERVGMREKREREGGIKGGKEKEVFSMKFLQSKLNWK